MGDARVQGIACWWRDIGNARERQVTRGWWVFLLVI